MELDSEGEAPAAVPEGFMRRFREKKAKEERPPVQSGDAFRACMAMFPNKGCWNVCFAAALLPDSSLGHEA